MKLFDTALPTVQGQGKAISGSKHSAPIFEDNVDDEFDVNDNEPADPLVEAAHDPWKKRSVIDVTSGSVRR